MAEEHLKSYLEADERVRELYAKPDEWAALAAILNIAASGKFSSDRTIADYAAPVPSDKIHRTR